MKLHAWLVASSVSLALCACSNDDATPDDEDTRDAGSDVEVDAATGEVSDVKVTGPISTGRGEPFNASPLDLNKHGYDEREFFLEGEAVAYAAEGEQEIDGAWKVKETTRAEYKTRVIVRRPVDAADFNGTVIVEWLNVSGGVDADPGFAYEWEEIVREGYAYVGISAQKAGVEGGGFMIPLPGGAESMAMPLKKWDEARYGTLVHPGDDYSFDIYTQAADVIRHPGKLDLLDGLRAKHLIAYGESQSAMRMVTYVNAVHPLAKRYDGFFIHSRGVGAAPLTDPGGLAGLGSMSPVHIRQDGEQPVFQFMTESDVVGLLGKFLPARQPDSERLRTWEVAGTAHADKHLIDFQMQDFDFGCGMVNDGPQHFVLKAALHALLAWVVDGTLPPSGTPLRLNEAGSAIERDAMGNALDGIRTPHVDVPIAVLSGAPAQGSSILCSLFGQTLPFSDDELAKLYPTHQAYVDEVTAAAAKARKAGFLLKQEEATLIEEANEAAVPKP